MIRWKVDYENLGEPKAVECAQVGWPHLDADGDKQFDNSHFDTERQAWVSTLREARAGLRLDERDLQSAKEMLRMAETRVLRSNARLQRVYSVYAERFGAPPLDSRPTERDAGSCEPHRG